MDRSDTIKLISETITVNSYGVEVTNRTYREVFAQVDSITRAEFFDAGRSGLNPEFKFTVFAGDYAGETLVEYAGKAYAVYRTYLGRNDNLELYVQREGGANGKAYSY